MDGGVAAGKAGLDCSSPSLTGGNPSIGIGGGNGDGVVGGDTRIGIGGENCDGVVGGDTSVGIGGENGDGLAIGGDPAPDGDGGVAAGKAGSDCSSPSSTEGDNSIGIGGENGDGVGIGVDSSPRFCGGNGNGDGCAIDGKIHQMKVAALKELCRSHELIVTSTGSSSKNPLKNDYIAAFHKWQLDPVASVSKASYEATSSYPHVSHSCSSLIQRY